MGSILHDTVSLVRPNFYRTYTIQTNWIAVFVGDNESKIPVQVNAPGQNSLDMVQIRYVPACQEGYATRYIPWGRPVLS